MMKKILIPLLFLVQIGYGQSVLNKLVDFKVDQESITDALKRLSQQCDADIAFTKKFFNNNTRLDFDFKQQSVEAILMQLLKGSDITYKVLGERILLYRKPYFTLSGYIEDEAMGERLLSATIYCPDLQKGTVTNEYGFFSLSLPEGDHKLVFSYLGYEALQQTYNCRKDQQIKIGLKNAATFSEVLVTEVEEGAKVYGSGANLGAEPIFKEMVSLSPTLAGVEDPVRTATMMAGIQSGAEGLDGILVRGGDNGQNLMLLDGAPIYIPYHLLGLFSVYHQDMVKSAKVYKGGFPARYGGRVSSVFDIRTRDGNQNDWNAALGFNLVNFEASVEGPLFEDKGAVLLSGRWSPSGFLLNPFFRRTYFRTDSEDLTTQFHDWNAKLNYTLSNKDRLYLSFYSGRDLMEGSNVIQEDDLIEESSVELEWANRLASFRWNHLFNNQLFSNLTLTYSSFDYRYTVLEEFLEEDEEETLQELYYADMRSFNTDWGLSIDFDYWPSNNQKVKFGGGMSSKVFGPNLTFFEETDEELDDLDDITIKEIEKIIETEDLSAVEGFVYVENDFNWNDKINVNMGLRLSSFWTEDQHFTQLEPRISAQYRPTTSLSVYAGLNRMVQYLHVISLSNIRLPNDLWLPANEALPPQTSWQTEVGFAYESNHWLSLSVNAYAKEMNNLFRYPEGFAFDVDNFLDLLVEGTGQAKGIETSLLVNESKWGGQISYAITEATRQSPKIAAGKRIDHLRHQPHQVKCFLYYKPTAELRFGLNWVFFSRGSIPQISPLGTEQILLDDEADKIDAKPADNLLFNHYHRLDLNVNYTFKAGVLQHEFKLGAYNVYNQANLAYYRLDFNEDGAVGYQPVNGLGFQPSVSYRVKW